MLQVWAPRRPPSDAPSRSIEGLRNVSWMEPAPSTSRALPPVSGVTSGVTARTTTGLVLVRRCGLVHREDAHVLQDRLRAGFAVRRSRVPEDVHAIAGKEEARDTDNVITRTETARMFFLAPPRRACCRCPDPQSVPRSRISPWRIAARVTLPSTCFSSSKRAPRARCRGSI